MKTTISPSELARFRDRLISAFTQYDAKQSTKRGHNPYALGIYFQRADDICADVAAGADPRAAICAGISDRLLSFVLRSMGLDAPSNDECRGTGHAWHYVPASEAKTT